MIYLAALLLVCSAGLVVYASRPAGQARKVAASIDRLESYDARSFRKAELDESAGDRLIAPTLAWFATMGRAMTPKGRLRRLQTKVEQAGRPYNLDLNGLMATKFVSLAGGVLFLVLVGSRGRPSAGLLFALGAFILVASYYLPDILLHFWVKSRKKKITRALPDFLDLLTITVEAGLGLDAAMLRISEKMKGPLREEILITLHHMRIGQSREAALREFARRADVKDLDNFVAALIQAQRLGVGIGQILRVQSTHLRTMRRQRIEEAANKLSIKMLFPLVLCIFPMLFVIILVPSVIRIYEFFTQ